MGAPNLTNIAVIIATRGRPALASRLVGRLLETQTLRPAHVFVVGASEDDLAGVVPGDTVTAVVGRAGLPCQRNRGLDLAGDRFGTFVFFDDDFVPSRFWLENAATIFGQHPDIVGLTGIVLADGAKTAGIEPGAGEALVDTRDAAAPAASALHGGFGPYGCNMAFRAGAAAGLRFDERLPLYGWLEDSDFGGRIGQRGRTVKADALWGVHLGNKGGRERGLRLGYSQIANPAYLMGKRSLPRGFLLRLMAKNVGANCLRAFAPEPFCDRRGRLAGNMLALGDLVRGRVTPERAALL